MACAKFCSELIAGTGVTEQQIAIRLEKRIETWTHDLVSGKNVFLLARSRVSYQKLHGLWRLYHYATVNIDTSMIYETVEQLERSCKYFM